jgi:cell division protease FtsH
MCENGPAMLNYEHVPGGDKIIAEKMNELATELYKQSFKLLADNSNKLETLAEELIKRETLSETEILEIINSVPMLR